ncbi:MAG: hypothetical protein WAN14_15430 [Candidatus Acidiferrales bacterium]
MHDKREVSRRSRTVGWSLATVILVALCAGAQSSAPTLDFEYFKTKVEPIFLEKREGHARCYTCHAEGRRAAFSQFRLQTIAPDATFWTDEQSRTNFELVSKLVVPGEPLKSHFVMHTLNKDAGGDFLHQGGRQFLSKDDPDWKILAAWVAGAKAGDAGSAATSK